MTNSKSIDIPPTSAAAFTVTGNQTIRITDIQGGQPGDFVAWNADDLSEHFSQSRTRVENRSCTVTAGNSLWTNAIPPRIMFQITRDTAGNHDLLYTPCCRYALQKRFAISRSGCLENLAQALKPWKIAATDIPDPLNLFFNVNVAPDSRLSIGHHSSQAGDCMELRAEIDALVAISTCAVPIEGRPNSGFIVDVFD